MKYFMEIVYKFVFPLIGISLVLLRLFFPEFIIYLYVWAFLDLIFKGAILLILFLSAFSLYKSIKEKLSEFKKNFQVYKPIPELDPSDFGIFKYYETYIHRESDTQVEESFEENGIAFLTGKPGIGKTRGVFEVAKKLKDYYILKPTYEKIDIQNLKFPHLFSRKKVILFLDDLEKYAGKFGLDELIAVLKKNSKELKVLATCITGKEFEQAFGQKEMGILLSQCRSNKVVPRILKEGEEKELAEGIGKKWEEVTSDGTPGSIVLGLEQMEKRYKDLEDEPRTILHILKLLREANIFIWAEELLKNIAKSKIFELKVERYQWDNWLKVLQDNGFIQKSDGKINISHDSYLDNKFITDYPISDSILIELKDELFNLKDAKNLFQLGSSLYYRKNLEEGIDCYNKSIKINPDYAETHINLGNLLSDLKNYPEAEKEFRNAIKINPDYAEAHYNLGILLYDLKNYPEAEKEYRIAIKINPDDAKAHNNLGLLLYGLKNYPEAEQEYRIAIKINPDYTDAHNNLGVLLDDLKNYPEAEKEYRAAIKINPDYADAHYNLGNLLKDLKNYTEAEQVYQTAIKINPDYAEAYGNLGLLYIEMGKKEEAKKELQKAKELFKKQGKEEDVKEVEDILKGLE